MGVSSLSNRHFCNIPRKLPKTTVVKITSLRDVVTITPLFENFVPSILRTRPKAIAPLIIPANQMKIYYLKLSPESNLQSFKSARRPTVAINLPMMMTKICEIKSSGDQSKLWKLKTVKPR